MNTSALKWVPRFEIPNRTNMFRTVEPNRTTPLNDDEFARALELETSRARSGGQLGLILFGLDNLRDIYESAGRVATDALLDQLGAHLARRVRAHDLFARFPGGEFALLTPGMELSEVTGCAVKLRHLVHEFHFNRIGRIGASFGVTHHQPGETGELLQARARRALDRARAAGGNRVSAARAQP